MIIVDRLLLAARQFWAKPNSGPSGRNMAIPFAELETQRLVCCRLLEELLRRRTPGDGGWSHRGTQFGGEPTALALLALHSGSIVLKEGIEPLMARQATDGLWSDVGEATDVNFWATALAVNTLSILGAEPPTYADSLEALIRSRPMEASWLVSLKFRFLDRHVQFDPRKYGWPWVPETVSWVAPTAMALIALKRAKRHGLVSGGELERRLRLGTEMLIDRACPEGGWNAGNAVVYGVPLRPHVDTTALALLALRPLYHLPIVRNSLRWLLRNSECLSAYSLAWMILAADVYKDVGIDVSPAINSARVRLATLVEDPRTIEDTSTIALAALALGLNPISNPFEVEW